jgi:hypothetical protein
MGCGERVRIKSYPPGALAYLNDELIGTTPAETKMSRRQVSRRNQWRVEFRNCEPAVGELRTRVAPGRVVGYIFTAGILAIFRGPYAFVPVDAVLTGGDCETGGHAAPVRQPTAPPGITIQQIVGDQNRATGSNVGDGMTDTQRLAERLTILRDLHNRKLISEEIYERESQKALDELE